MFHLVRTEYQTTRELAERCLTLAERQQDLGLLITAHTLLGASFFWSGVPVSACTHLEKAFTLYDPHSGRNQMWIYETDLGVFSGTDESLALWCCGYPNQALKRNREAFFLAQELSHPPSIVLALVWTAIFQQLCWKNVQTVREQTEAAMPLMMEHGLPDYLTLAIMLHGWALTEQKQEEKGIAEIHQGLTPERTFGSMFLRPYSLALLAEAQSKTGQFEEALITLAEALTITEKNEER